MKEILNLSAAKLKRIATVKAQLEKLQAQLQSLAGGAAAAGPGRPAGKRRKMSAAARAKIAAAARARWAKVKAAKAK